MGDVYGPTKTNSRNEWGATIYKVWSGSTIAGYGITDVKEGSDQAVQNSVTTSLTVARIHTHTDDDINLLSFSGDPSRNARDYLSDYYVPKTEGLNSYLINAKGDIIVMTPDNYKDVYSAYNKNNNYKADYDYLLRYYGVKR